MESEWHVVVSRGAYARKFPLWTEPDLDPIRMSRLRIVPVDIWEKHVGPSVVITPKKVPGRYSHQKTLSCVVLKADENAPDSYVEYYIARLYSLETYSTIDDDGYEESHEEEVCFAEKRFGQLSPAKKWVEMKLYQSRDAAADRDGSSENQEAHSPKNQETHGTVNHILVALFLVIGIAICVWGLLSIFGI